MDLLQSTGKCFHPRCSAVIIVLQAWMNNQFFQRKLCIDTAESFPLIRVFDSDSGLYRYRKRTFLQHFFQQHFQFFRICQKAGPFSFRDNGSGRTAKIKIDTGKSQIFQLPNHHQKFISTVSDQVRHQPDLLIIFRCQIPLYFFAHFFCCRDKRCKIFIYIWKIMCISIAHNISRNSLHRSKIKQHNFPSIFLL